MDYRRKLSYILAGILALVIHFNVQASLVSVNASAQMSGGLARAIDLLPIGTQVISDVTFNIGVGTIDTSIIDNVSGTFSWVDSVFGAQTFQSQSAAFTTTHSDGWFILRFSGIGPTIDGITAEDFGIKFNIGTNPFLPPGSTEQLYDLILGSSIDGMRVGARQGATTYYGDLYSNASGTVNAVPVPGALGLFIAGLFGLFSSRFVRS